MYLKELHLGLWPKLVLQHFQTTVECGMVSPSPQRRGCQIPQECLLQWAIMAGDKSYTYKSTDNTFIVCWFCLCSMHEWEPPRPSFRFSNVRHLWLKTFVAAAQWKLANWVAKCWLWLEDRWRVAQQGKTQNVIHISITSGLPISFWNNNIRAGILLSDMHIWN